MTTQSPSRRQRTEDQPRRPRQEQQTPPETEEDEEEEDELEGDDEDEEEEEEEAQGEIAEGWDKDLGEDELEGSARSSGGNVLDFDAEEEIPEKKYVLLPNGTVAWGEIDSSEFGYSESSGNPMITVQFLFSDPKPRYDEEDNELDPAKVRVWMYIVLNAENRARAKRQLLLLKPDLPRKFDPEKDADILEGQWIKAKLKIKRSREHGNKNEVKEILESRSPDESPIGEEVDLPF